MFLRIFRYRVQPQMRDRHLAIQARSAQLYGNYVSRSPSYFRRSGDANNWVELHWYTDKAECQQVAQAVADDLELARLWREFQETLDPDYPPTLEEFGEYELPRPVSASPFAQPPIDAEPAAVAPSAPAKSIHAAATATVAATAEAPQPNSPEPTAAIAEKFESVSKPEHAPLHPTSDNGDGRSHAADANANGAASDADIIEATSQADLREADVEDASSEPSQRPHWPSPPLPAESKRDDLIIEDDLPIEPRSNSLSFNDGVWIVEPEDKPAPRREDH
jgi:hypothetical protein